MKVRIKTTPYGRYFFGTINRKNLRGQEGDFRLFFASVCRKAYKG